jgi:hypothetical protein
MSKDLLEQQPKARTEIQLTKDNKWLDKSKTLFSKSFKTKKDWEVN